MVSLDIKLKFALNLLNVSTLAKMNEDSSFVYFMVVALGGRMLDKPSTTEPHLQTKLPFNAFVKTGSSE